MAFSEKEFLSLNSAGLHRIIYNDWGPQDGNPVLCVHGLTGNGHDFDYLAERLIQCGHRVIAIDLPGRGRSDFLQNPMDYNYRQYWQDIMALLAHLDLSKPQCIDWIGVSLGGLLGMYLASLENTPIRRMILNDIGPEVPQNALDFIYHVIAQEYSFPNIRALEDRMRQTRGLTWGPVSDEQWVHMAEHNARALPCGDVSYSYDPQIARIFESEPTGPLDLWPFWKNIACPIQLIHGAQSVILTPDIIERMRGHYQGAGLDLVQFADCGHVPSLMSPHHIEVIEKWLNVTPMSS